LAAWKEWFVIGEWVKGEFGSKKNLGLGGISVVGGVCCFCAKGMGVLWLVRVLEGYWGR